MNDRTISGPFDWRYRRACKRARTAFLDEFSAVCRFHRKYAIRVLSRRGKPSKQQRPERQPVCLSTALYKRAETPLVCV
ncbi:MAG: hypothetical protein IIC58_10965 [Proteobacteria bacterium]|nr:hypothetical protein [Pseudomonadota bacterium]